MNASAARAASDPSVAKRSLNIGRFSLRIELELVVELEIGIPEDVEFEFEFDGEFDGALRGPVGVVPGLGVPDMVWVRVEGDEPGQHPSDADEQQLAIVDAFA